MQTQSLVLKHYALYAHHPPRLPSSDFYAVHHFSVLFMQKMLPVNINYAVIMFLIGM